MRLHESKPFTVSHETARFGGCMQCDGGDKIVLVVEVQDLNGSLSFSITIFLKAHGIACSHILDFINLSVCPIKEV